jgi:hypothetical protein
MPETEANMPSDDSRATEHHLTPKEQSPMTGATRDSLRIIQAEPVGPQAAAPVSEVTPGWIAFLRRGGAIERAAAEQLERQQIEIKRLRALLNEAVNGDGWAKPSWHDRARAALGNE